MRRAASPRSLAETTASRRTCRTRSSPARGCAGARPSSSACARGPRAFASSSSWGPTSRPASPATIRPHPRGRAHPPPHRPRPGPHRPRGRARASRRLRRAARPHPLLRAPRRASISILSAVGRCVGVYVLDSRAGAGPDLPRAGGRARHRRQRQGLSLHDQPRRRDRRRRGHGLARRRDHRQHGVHAVPPHLPLPPTGAELPHQRGAARRGRHPAAAQRPDVHGALPSPARARAARHRGARHRRRDEAHRRRLRHARHDPPDRELF